MGYDCVTVYRDSLTRFITVLRESIRGYITVSQWIEMAVRIDITVLQSIEMAVRRDKSVSQLRWLLGLHDCVTVYRDGC